MMALNVKLRSDNDGFEHRNWKYGEDSSKHWYWWVMALKTELKVDNDSECQTKQNMASNVGMNDVLAVNVEREYDSERQTEE